MYVVCGCVLKQGKDITTPSLTLGIHIFITLFASPEEDARLLEAVKQLGVGKWAAVAGLCAPRTDNQCWRRWKVLHQDQARKYVYKPPLKRGE